jgi:hypothetical protein
LSRRQRGIELEATVLAEGQAVLKNLAFRGLSGPPEEEINGGKKS